ncbi:hypothetical protein SAMN05216410_3527 [Sanguibacter gelidistatuariae]|uniref:Uncharacterized protein n=1 Tax=Sanguibacter gelidistatuariae TaxID=1814289 RepID=A0A1G6VUV4_9MICO|nr:Rv3235 family protein [Sanguibacter gelidistatuariae]SDD56616.1 hypothetical protein SAMN05216410_3527 [Sanguibacter gelidistatuariae]
MSTPTLRTAPRTPAILVPTRRSTPPRAEPIAQPVRALHRTDFLPAHPLTTVQRRRGGLQEFTHHPNGPSEPPAPPTTDPGVPLGDPTALCCAVAHAAMESLRGIRPLAQLVRSVSPEVFDALYARCQVREQARTRPGAPPVSQSRARVRHARVIRIASGVAEATVIVDDVDRVRAAALRVEEHRGRWWVVVLEIG